MDTLIGSLIGICVFGAPIFLVLVGVGIGWWVITGQPKQQAAALRNKFVSMGDLRGKTRADIEKVVGPPKSWAGIGENKVSCSWNTNRYHITLIFDGDICEGVSSEISV